MQHMSRVAVPNKGALSESAVDILSEAGYRRRTDPERPDRRRPAQQR